ncbi:protein kinase domain-containing protein [Chloropicon primus]|uniref:Protein kinase domain-containing protein n=1 Tax=Chloropicon primus TaxID=1764295 RepID=A0A5B8MFQ3_9CHLO|nr:hypothetical protein A3770_02p17470 [Chloropicon primus]UPQ98438.1 protein kinase domain-containing protein [Chloropicon primus]|eukprot:QDZ19229.1 hypothetical protein A3770_02p17470 [Chloropicon primus]
MSFSLGQRMSWRCPRAVAKAPWELRPRAESRRSLRPCVRCRAAEPLYEFNAEDFSDLRQIGELALKRIDSISGLTSVDEVKATVRVYSGAICAAGFEGMVIAKEYPEQCADLAANEVAAHARVARSGHCENVCSLLGTYDGRVGERWLVFSNDCIYPLSYWCEQAKGIGEQKQQRNWTLLSFIDPELDLKRRKAFLIQVVRGALGGLQQLHAAELLHQNLTPDCVLLSTVDEREKQVKVKLRELSFCVSVGEANLRGGGTLAELWEAGRDDAGEGMNVRKQREMDLWRRSEESGCESYFQKKNFGIADDIYEMGLVLLYVILKSFSPEGTPLDMATLRRYVDVTFSGSIKGEMRDFIRADEQYQEAVEWLDSFDGWGLIEAMVNPGWKSRPTAESCLGVFEQATIE